ncbi:unnamed protein product [Closterium sp. NIES-64]|nr:unnamed protein product [Closterium sp. NIES-64]
MGLGRYGAGRWAGTGPGAGQVRGQALGRNGAGRWAGTGPGAGQVWGRALGRYGAGLWAGTGPGVGQVRGRALGRYGAGARAKYGAGRGRYTGRARASGPVGAPSVPVAALPGPSRPLAAPSPPLRGPVAAPCGPVAAPSGPVAASLPTRPRRRPYAAPSPPLAASSAPLRGPVAAPSGPVWVDDLQLFLQCDRADGLSLFDLTSGASPSPPATAESTVRSQWATRDAAARLAVRRHLPTIERAHFSQYKGAQTLYDAVVARHSSPATAALSRLMLPYLFHDLAAFPTVADLITHLRTSDTRYRAALPAEFCVKNPPPLYITLYYIVTRLPDSLRLVRDHFLSVCPTTLTVDLLEERLLAAEKSIFAVGASRGDPRTPVFKGCSPSPLLPSVASAAAADLVGFESVGAASAPGGRRSTGKGKGGKGARGAGGGGGGGSGGCGGGGGGGGSGGGGGCTNPNH